MFTIEFTHAQLSLGINALLRHRNALRQIYAPGADIVAELALTQAEIARLSLAITVPEELEEPPTEEPPTEEPPTEEPPPEVQEE